MKKNQKRTVTIDLTITCTPADDELTAAIGTELQRAAEHFYKALRLARTFKRGKQATQMPPGKSFDDVMGDSDDR